MLNDIGKHAAEAKIYNIFFTYNKKGQHLGLHFRPNRDKDYIDHSFVVWIDKLPPHSLKSFYPPNKP